ncbi:restriction endonuclease subunit S [Colwellia sp. UCD-KL20]|uniref:restriction endonuclease subunit S n=1 Tax=Colwellia sp. UCD-KL20 TaxID=1917165 RepID=UPI0009711164|nr:restriction endonuclease subunit S [Colwellia sp. UCD-KL20]
MEYPAYDSYKPSSIDWIDKVPSHWVTWKVTHGFNLVGSGTTPKSDNQSYYEGGETPWITTSELREKEILDTKFKITKTALADYSTLKVYKPGSLAFAMYGATIGRLGILGIDATVNQACCVFDEPEQFDTKFFFYWLWMRRDVLISLSVGGGQPNLSQDDLKQIRAPIPPVTEQQKISAFLDYKTQQIDHLIEKKKALIEKLEEKRIAVITQTVTKGINNNIKLKPSGKHWLGDIPKNWVCSYLKHFSLIYDCKHLTAQFVDDGYPLASISEVKGWYVDLATSKKTTYEYYHDLIAGERKPKAGDIIYSRNATVGEAAIVSKNTPDFAMGQDVCLIRSSDLLLPDFLMYFLNSKLILQQLDLLMVGSTFKRINVNDIKNFTLLIPPIEEQKQIIDYLIEVENKSQSMVLKVSEALERLEEYKAALVTSAVTGKIDVREIELPKEFQ